MFITQEKVFKFNPFPMIYDHYEIDLNLFPANSYLGGTSLLSIMYKNFKIGRLCVFIHPKSKEDYEKINNLGIYVSEGDSIGFKMGMIDVVIIQDPIEEYARCFFMLARCYMNIHDQEIKLEKNNELSKEQFISDLEYFNEFLTQMRFKKIIVVDDTLIDIKKIYKWVEKSLPEDSVNNGHVLYKGTLYKMESFLKVTNYLSERKGNTPVLDIILQIIHSEI